MARMKTLLSVLLLTTAFPAVSLAQDAAPSEPQITDEVIVEGQRRGADEAMSAFLRGDFETAEVEFEKNYDRLREKVRLKETSVEQAESDAIQAVVTEGAGISGGTPPTGQIAGGQGVTLASGVYVNNASRNREKGILSSGTDLGSQLYMAGLSEIQLQKFDEAQQSFTKALRLNPTLTDAHFRLGLIALQNGDVDEAQRRLSQLESELDRCYGRCERLGNREDLEIGIAQLSRFLTEQ